MTRERARERERESERVLLDCGGLSTLCVVFFLFFFSFLPCFVKKKKECFCFTFGDAEQLVQRKKDFHSVLCLFFLSCAVLCVCV